MIVLYEAVTDAGGVIGAELNSGQVDQLFPEISKAEQLAGVTISRKVYFKNEGAETIDLWMELVAGSTFPMIMFLSTGDAQVVGDLTGSETNESPINQSITAGSHVSCWFQMQIPALSNITENYSIIDLSLIHL